MDRTTDPAAQLAETLDLDATAARLVDSLSHEEARRFAEDLATARVRSAQTLDATIEGIIAVVPRLFRGRIKRILVGR